MAAKKQKGAVPAKKPHVGSKPANLSRNKATEDSEVSLRKTTRICIKHLPPTLADATQLRNFLFQSQNSYFSNVPLTITDCKVFPKRHIAFVGCSTVDAAEACVKYLHRSYFRSSRLVVEFALPPKEVTSDELTKGEDAETSIVPKHEDVDKSDPKKAEFLSAMGVSLKKQDLSRVWSNDDGLVEDPNVTSKKANDAVEGSSDESEDSDDEEADPISTTATPKQQSDMDFLRSKTVAAQDLEAESEDEDQHSTVDHDNDDDEMGSDQENEALPLKSPGVTVLDQDEDPGEKHGSERKDGKEGESISPNRLFVRNIAFDTSEDDLKEIFAAYGTVEECHIPVDDQRKGKGFAFLAFTTPEAALSARQALDGTDFQGRLIHILPARRAPTSKEPLSSELSFKERQELERRGKSLKDQTGWSASHVRSDAVVDNLAARLGLRKGDILSVKDGMGGGDAAVRLALAETAIIEENRKYFAEHGVDMEALVSFSTKGSEGGQERSKNALLVKNLPHDTTTDELLQTFGKQGADPSRILLPPSRTIAVVEFSHPNDAKKVFKRLAYRRFKNVPLYLEWAPVASIVKAADSSDQERNQSELKRQNSDPSESVDGLDETSGPSFTVYVKNLNFSTTEEELQSVFERCARDIRTIRIPRKVAAVKRGGNEKKNDSAGQSTLSMGYGFAEFNSQESARMVVQKLQGVMVAGHALELQIARGSSGQSATSSKIPTRPPCKIMVRNVPFQATRTELLQLFGSFGQLKKARLPRKFDGNHRGFAFIEFVSGKEAAAAMKALSRTHLYGRHLVLEWAEADDEDTQGMEVHEPVVPKNKKIRFD